ncbi:MAG TPA: sulfatase-like hydrolase/transferase, partial [bacterium]|nr:sulfatase-like hydrolase/transferase [bacterium]
FHGQDYTPTLMYNEMEKFVESNKDHPFFFYWASLIPHVALAAPEKWVNYYREKFGEEEPYTGDSGYLPSQYPRATYAAMISYLDENVGKLVKKLKDLGIYDNTLIIFTSDNGPTYTGGADTVWFDSADPFKSEYGYSKGFVNEGGIRVPMIAQWPGKIKPGSQSDHISAFYDVMPTMCDLGKTECDVETDGISFAKTLLGKKGQEEHKYLYWEFPAYGGQQAVRMGKWKAIRKNIKKGNMKIELYNLEKDLQEQNNVADQHPEIVSEVKKIMEKEHQTSRVKTFRMKALDS